MLLKAIIAHEEKDFILQFITLLLVSILSVFIYNNGITKIALSYLLVQLLLYGPFENKNNNNNNNNKKSIKKKLKQKKKIEKKY